MRWCLAWLLALLVLGSAGAAFGQDCVPDELLVKFQPGTPAAVRAAAYQALGATLRQQLPTLDVDVLGLPPGVAPQQAAAVCSRSAWVQYAEPDPVFAATSVPNDPSFAQEWGLTKIQAPQAWDVTLGSPGVPIAILDSGIDQSHPDLAAKIVASMNFSSSNTDDDLYGHGTHLAGIAAAVTNNGVGIAGVGANCTLINAKVMEDDGRGASASALAQGILWATDVAGAKVICMSLSSSQSSQTVQNAIGYAWSRGVVLVASAGNSNSAGPNYPAAYTQCISVAATDPSDQREVAPTGGSTFGSWVDVAAPGLNILSTLPTHSTPLGQNYGALSGTSQSAAFVAGLAGLVWSTPFGTSNAAVRARIEATCDRIPGTGTLWASGRINAARAVGAIP